jgi:hypothetical protein
VLDRYPLQLYVLGRHQMKVPRSFRLENLSMFLLGTWVNTKPAPAGNDPRAIEAAAMAAHVRKLQEDAATDSYRTPWTFEEKALPAGGLFLHGQREKDHGDVDHTYEGFFSLGNGRLLSVVFSQSESQDDTTLLKELMVEERANFFKILNAVELTPNHGIVPVIDPSWLHLPGAVLKLPYPRELFDNRSIQDDISVSFVDEEHEFELFLSFEYPEVAEGPPLLPRILKAIAVGFSSIDVIRSGMRSVDGGSGEEMLAIDRRAESLFFAFRYKPSFATRDYRPAVDIKLRSKLRRKQEAMEVWDPVLDSVHALVRSGGS